MQTRGLRKAFLVIANLDKPACFWFGEPPLLTSAELFHLLLHAASLELEVLYFGNRVLISMYQVSFKTFAEVLFYLNSQDYFRLKIYKMII